MPIEPRLESLVEETVDDVVCREGSAFDEIAGRFGETLVLFGAGGLGRKTLAGLRRMNIRPIAFSDNNPALWGQEIDGIPILSPEDAANRFGDTAAFVVTIWRAGGGHRLSHTRQQLRQMHCSCIVSFAYLFWKYPDIFLPYYCLDLPHKIIPEREDILTAFKLLADEESRQEYIAQMRFRLFLDFDSLPSPSSSVQYFPDHLFDLNSEEVFIDCGAFDGDTIRAFMKRMDSLFKRIHALEPDPLNFRQLEEFIAALPQDVQSRIILHRIAAAEYRGQIGFALAGNASSAADATAMMKVDCAPLDQILSPEVPTYIKLDIEGAEMDALKGAAGLIRQHKPVLAVSVYHRQDHLWRIPLYLKTLFPGYQFFLRPHNEEAWDLICYAIPEERVVR
jgi:FkbM family methyltransferase